MQGVVGRTHRGMPRTWSMGAVDYVHLSPGLQARNAGPGAYPGPSRRLLSGTYPADLRTEPGRIPHVGRSLAPLARVFGWHCHCEEKRV